MSLTAQLSTVSLPVSVLLDGSESVWPTSSISFSTVKVWSLGSEQWITKFVFSVWLGGRGKLAVLSVAVGPPGGGSLCLRTVHPAGAVTVWLTTPIPGMAGVRLVPVLITFRMA